jgi:ATP-dependent exoDNAse (exonuclease V) beta subunit
LFKWLVRFSEEKILEGKTWNILSDLYFLGQEIFKEEFSKNAHNIYSILQNTENLEKFRKNLHARIGAIERMLGDMSRGALDEISRMGLEQQDFYQKGRGLYPYLVRLTRGEVILPNRYILKLLDGPELWPASDSERKEKVIRLAERTLLSDLNGILSFLQENVPTYYTSKEILKNIFSLGILSNISSWVSRYRQEKNMFILSDAPVFIHRIIDQNEAPFIYERMGNRYKHFLIDEFQDTSRLQWDNFKPLISNSLSKGDACLLVGDVKQSIYRWRDSDWEILASQVLNYYPKSQLEIRKLDTNWRSKEYVTAFNSGFFASATQIIKKKISGLEMPQNPDFPDHISVLESIYNDVSQEVLKKFEGQGTVRIRFFERSGLTEQPESLDRDILEQINGLIRQGYSLGEIAVLVRSKKEGQYLAELLIQNNAEGYFHQEVNVISNESLFLYTSNALNLLVAALKFLIQPGDIINRGKLIRCYRMQDQKDQPLDSPNLLEWEINCSSEEAIHENLPGAFIDNIQKFLALPLYDMMEHLIRVFALQHLPDEVAFLHTFLDLVHDFVQSNTSDPEKFLDYWDKEGKTRSVPATESQDAIRILTIHKAKGLEYPAIVIPFCNWSMEQQPNTILWSKPTAGDFDFLPVYPVFYNKNLAYSYFAGTYFNEQFKTVIDNLNLLYVAFTRAKDVLIVNAQINNLDNKSVNINNTGDLVFQSVMNFNSNLSESCFNEEGLIFFYGKPVERTMPETREHFHEMLIKPSDGGNITDRLYFHPEGYDFFSERQQHQDQLAMKGTVLHEVLSKIVITEDMEYRLKDALLKGLINHQELIFLNDHILKALKLPEVFDWFNGSGEVINEAEILLPTGEIRRPDRLILFPERTVVVDYKFGSREFEMKHRKQVKEYKKLMGEMGYPGIRGYVWYIMENYIVEV